MNAVSKTLIRMKTARIVKLFQSQVERPTIDSNFGVPLSKLTAKARATKKKFWS